MHDWITQVGAGGAFVLIALKLLLDYSKIGHKKREEFNPLMKEVGQRLLNLENRMGTNESATYRSTGIMEQVVSRLDRLEDRIWEKSAS